MPMASFSNSAERSWYGASTLTASILLRQSESLRPARRHRVAFRRYVGLRVHRRRMVARRVRMRFGRFVRWVQWRRCLRGQAGHRVTAR
jgi:hypothetical protein